MEEIPEDINNRIARTIHDSVSEGTFDELSDNSIDKHIAWQQARAVMDEVEKAILAERKTTAEEIQRLQVDASNHAADAETVRRERDRLYLLLRECREFIRDRGGENGFVMKDINEALGEE